MNASVAFDAATHTYGDGMPSVTQILEEVGLLRKDFYTDEGLARGKALHAATQYYDEGDLDPKSIDPAIAGYFEAYLAWERDYGVKPDWIELPIRGLDYAGTPDRVMIVRPRALWDLKTGAYQRWHRWQSAAYVNMLDDPFSYSRFGLYLRSNGKYSVKEFPKSEYLADLNVFLAALTIVNAKKEA